MKKLPKHLHLPHQKSNGTNTIRSQNNYDLCLREIRSA
ncbi:unnamed protein product [Cylicostephanus goldi]|uniref:Uncharacterized protein n=1 Tax=Cylicostephanus goldi TaxID=71465 RepID=A0A3P7R4G7_CYLGO|nr:unnamed protein product [Cylicostephanus goldi]